MGQPLTTASAKAAADRMRERLRRQHIARAQQARREVEAKQGVAPTVTVVDGRRGASEMQVQAGGKIVYLFDATPRAWVEVINHLRDIAPVDRSPDADDVVFRESFVTLVGEAEGLVAKMKPGEQVTIVNRQPYSRRLELGWSLQAPDGVFQVAAKWLRTRWGKAVEVQFTYVGLDGMTVIGGREGNKSSTRYPCIILKSKVI